MNRSLLDCISLVIDKRGVTPKKLKADWSDSGYRVLSANNVKTGCLQNLEEIRHIDELTYRKWMTQEIQKGDILLTSEAPAGEVFYWDSNEKIVAGQRIFILRPSKDIYPQYLYYCLQTIEAKKEIAHKCSGSTVFGISAEMFRHIVLNINESYDEQKKIGDFIYSIEKKINNNKKQIKALESIAKTIYDYWFVQFDFPNEDGKPYKSSGGKMVWNEELKREIPEGWNETCIEKITNCLDSKRIPLSGKQRELKKGNIPYYGATSIMGFIDEFIFDGDYVLMAEDGSIMTSQNTPILQRISGKTWVNNHAHVIEPIGKYSCSIIFHFLKNVYVPSLKTGSIQAKITQNKMNSIKVVNIPDALLEKYNETIEPLDKKIKISSKEISNLNKVKRYLLPLIMNGQVSLQ